MKVTYIHHSAFLVELSAVYLLFDYTEGNLPALKKDKPLLVFASHRHGDHFSPVIFELKKEYENTRYVLSWDIWRKRLPEEMLPFVDSVKHGRTLYYYVEKAAAENEAAGSSVSVREISGEEAEVIREAESKHMAANGFLIGIFTYKSTDEGVAFLVQAEGKTIYHAGDLNNWTWEGEEANWNRSMALKYSAQVDKMAGITVDAAFLPLDPRQEGAFYLGMDEFLRKVSVKHVFPMHCWGDFSVIGKLMTMECSKDYRDKITEISKDGESFELSS